MALEGPPRLPVRRLDGLHARHPGEPPRVPAGLQPGARTSFAPVRIGAIISPSCGAILDLGIRRYAGKGQGEVSLLRQLWDVLRPGDVLLGDRLMSGWVGMHLLKQRGVDTVSRLSAHRRADFRKGTRLGQDDHLVVWKKPSSIRSVDRKAYNALPDSIAVREVRFRVEQPGFRTRSVVAVTTILDPGQASAEELASLYRARWDTELDLRSIKIALKMNVLRCKTPELVRKEICTPRTILRNMGRSPSVSFPGRASDPDEARAGEPAARIARNLETTTPDMIYGSCVEV